MSPVRVGVAGAYGRMGRAIASAVAAAEGIALAGVFERPEHDAIGTPYALDPRLVVHAGPEPLVGSVDVLIDFTTPVASTLHAGWCAENGVALVLGTTGIEPEHQRAIDAATRRVAIVQAPNMSVGVNVLCALVSAAARLLGPSFDVEIVETHHRKKKDAPSGTALRLLEVAQAARPETTPVFERHGLIGERDPSEIGVQTLRGGDVVGEHTVFFFGDGERVELTHRATDRAVFAAGAVRAARWAAGRAPGRYAMSDVLEG